jgi:XTP/dITP diphosphohydrolase
MHKARYYGQKTGCLCLADDSGLCITALNNFPGVHTKDFMFSCKTQENALLIINEKLMDTPDRSATFYSAIAIYDPNKDQMIHHQDTHTGDISSHLRGEVRSGMFFDTMFIPQGSSQTLGELPLKIKNTIGHRAKALKVISAKLLKEYQ